MLAISCIPAFEVEGVVVVVEGEQERATQVLQKRTVKSRIRLSSSSSQGKENGYAAQRGVTQRSASALMKPVSLASACSAALVTGPFQRGRAHTHTHTPAITGRALRIPAVQPSCHHIT